MAVPTRAGFASQKTSGSGDVVLSPGAATGSWMVVVAVLGITTVTMSPPAGWTQLYYEATVGSRRVYVWGKIRESGDTTYTFTKSGSAFANVDIGWGVGSRPVAEWVLGAGKLRNTITENDTTNIAPSITTTLADTLVLAISAEATTTDSASPTISGGSPAAALWFENPDETGGIEFTSVAYMEKPTTGASGDVTFAYAVVQANNGWAVQIGIPAVAGEPDPDPEPEPGTGTLRLGTTDVLSGFLGTTAVSRLYLGVDMVAEFTNNRFTVADMLASSEILVAHRGLGNSYLEQSMVGYDAAVAAGFKVLEASLQRTSDGVFVLSHDSNGARVFGQGTTPISSQTWANVSLWNSPTGPILRLEELLEKYGNYVIFLDDKTNANKTALLSLLENYHNPQEHFVWKGFRGWVPAADTWTAAGYSSWGIYYSADNDPTKTPSYFENFTMLGLDYNGTQAHWDLMKATGKKVLAHVVLTDAHRIEGASKGADGYMMSNVNALP